LFLCSARHYEFLSQNPYNRNMNPKLPLLLCLLAAGAYFWLTREHRQMTPLGAEPIGSSDQVAANAVQSTAAADPSLNAAKIIAQAADELLARPPLHAKARFKVDLVGQQIAAPGEYWQQGNGSRKTRLEFSFQSDASRLQILQICDGRYFYWFRKLNAESHLEFVDLQQLEAIKAEPSPFIAGRRAWDTVGGLSSLMDHAGRMFEFQPVRRGTLDGIPVLVIEGRWRRESLARLLEGQLDPKQLEKDDWWRHVPPHLPHQVRFTLGMDDPLRLFPYRIEFLQHRSGNAGGVTHPVVTLELYEVATIADPPQSLFQITAGASEPRDLTAFYLERVQQFTRR
jgi:hypothetical protein